MSEASIKRVMASFMSRIKAECAAGRGEQLLHEVMAALAVDFASTVFLKMEDVLAKATEDTIDPTFDWLQEYPYQAGLELLDGVTSTIQQFGGSPEMVGSAQQVTVEAYQSHLNKLLATSQAGGRA